MAFCRLCGEDEWQGEGALCDWCEDMLDDDDDDLYDSFGDLFEDEDAWS